MAHYRKNDEYVGWGPTVQEIDYLARFFSEIRHIACLHQESAPLSSLPYKAKNLRLIPVPPAGGDAFSDKLKILKIFPFYFRKIRKELRWADIVHVRCPANISMLAIFMLLFLKNPPLRWVKYAGNWRPQGKEPVSYTLQRYWLEKGFSKGIVTVNGHWPDQPKHVYSFFNPSLTEQELEQARAYGKQKNLNLPLSLLFVGRIEEAKGVGRVLQITRELKRRGVDFELHLVGDGPERPKYEVWSEKEELSSHVTFHGWVPRLELARFYARAHFFLFPSSSEGWPKVLSEAMAYGTVPLAGAVSCIPQILSETQAGMALPTFSITSFVQAVMHYLTHSDQWQAASQAGMDAAANFTYEYYLKSLRKLFQKYG